ncbi:MAG: heavy-metal-associated domain-containing protein [Piscirickettsiaceae bacterium]|nr:heavy-metal-associated domain-containing protein [Piscirickettsiaceae bacterium]
MKQFLLIILFSTLWVIQTVQARTVEIEVYGMTCAFCIDSLERKFGKMKTVSKVEISLKQKKIRLETDESMPSIEIIKQTVLDAGFTPVKVTIDGDESEHK